VAGIEGLPDGYYRLHYLVDLGRRENVVLLINSLGQVFTHALEIADDPNPERGARKGLTSEGGGPWQLPATLETRMVGIRVSLTTFLHPPFDDARPVLIKSELLR
jgi:hypothetical protein